MKFRQTKILLRPGTLLVAFVLMHSASAQLIFHEPFDYPISSTSPDPDGGLNGGSGLPATNIDGVPSGTGTGWRNTYGAGMSVVEGLTYSQGPKVLKVSAGAGKPAPNWGTDVFAYRDMTTDPFLSQRIGNGNRGAFGVTGTSLFMSVLANTSSDVPGAFTFKLGSPSNYNLFIQNTATSWAISPNGAGPFTGFAPMVINETAFIVIRIDFVAGIGDVFNLWVNPPLDAPLGAPDVVHISVGTDYNGISNMNTKPNHTEAAAANAMIMDELRLGTTAASVMPTEGVAAPAAPSALAATSTLFSEANLTWSDNATNETQFVIERSPDGTTGWTIVGTPDNGTTSFVNTGLTASTPYFYRIRAENGGGASAVSATATVTTPAAVVQTPAPTGLAGMANSFSEITLSWTDKSNNEEGFQIERSPDGTTGWTVVGTTAPDAILFQNVGLAAATPYYYRVTALLAGNNSAPSGVVNVTTPVLPDPVALMPIYLPFDDADSTSIGAAAPVMGFSSYSGTASVATSSALAYPGLASPSGNGLVMGGNSNCSFAITTTLPGLTNYVSGGLIGGSGLGVLYVRWLARDIEGAQANRVDFAVGEDSKAGVGTTFDSAFIRAMADTSDLQSNFNFYGGSTVAAPVETALYVARFTFSPTGDTVMDVFVNQLTEGTPDSSATGKIKFDTIRLVNVGTAPEPSFDEFRIATTWEAAVNAGSGTPYTAWGDSAFANSFTERGPEVDFDHDGLANLLEFVLGGDPTVSDSSSRLSSVVTTGTNLVVTFKRSDASEQQPTSVKVQFSSDLVTWDPAFDVTIGATSNSGPIGPGSASYTVNEEGAFDSVVVLLPRGAAPKRFARVRAAQ